jgi:hypothetical protein
MKHFKGIVVAVFAVVIATLYNTPLLPVTAQSSASLSIVPRKNYTIESGKSINDTLTIRNLDSERSLDLTLRVVDFSFTDDGGTPKLMLDEDAEPTTWSLKSFMDVPKSVSIPPKTSRTLDMSVSIPAKQGAGSYYSAIVYSSGSPDGGNVGLSASGVTLVFTSVPGEVKEDLKLEKFGAYKSTQGKDGYKFITSEKPQRMAYTLKNNGNVTASPVGTITLKHMFGKEEIISDINPSKSLALIGQTRTFTTCIKNKKEDVDISGTRAQANVCAEPKLWPGRYSASLKAYYGQNGSNTQEIDGKGSFWYLPAWFIMIVVALVLAVIYFVRKTMNQFRGTAATTTKFKKPTRRR